MSSNSCGNSYTADVHSNMRAYDQLPKSVRYALANAAHNWSARQCLQALRSKEHPSVQDSKSLISAIHAGDERKRKELDT